MNSYITRSLTAGESIRYWQVGNTKEERFDVNDAPMKGEMDPFFFLTKHKNFIPHEYPCRTVFAKQFRDQRPQVSGEFKATRTWLPFDSPRLDLSGFWFRPTHLATWAHTCIDAKEAGEATLALTTCGGAVLWVNGHEIGWMAPYSRNLEDTIEISVPLRSGINEILVFFDDLAERDARYYLQLKYVSGPPAEIALPVETDASTADTIESALETMRLDKLFYLNGDITLLLDRPLPFDVKIGITVTGDFISFDRKSFDYVLATGKDRLNLGSSLAMSAGYRHFNITVGNGGFSATRILGAEICHGDSQESVPATQEQRIQEALEHFSECPERDAVCAFSRLAAGKGGAETDAIIDSIIPSIVECHDCSDFSLVPLLWSRIAWGGNIGEATARRFDNAVLNYRFWMDEPGNDVQWYFSENHALLFHTAAYLAGNLFREKTFVRSGRKGADQSAVGAKRLRAWFDHFEQWEMAEFNSAPYFPIDLKGLTALAALSPDADIAKRAQKGILRLCEIVARSAHQGMLTAAQGRSYEHTLCAGRTLELSGLSRLLWSKGWYGGQASTLPQLAVCLRDHGLEIPGFLKDVAHHKGEEHLEWLFAQGANGISKLYHYKSRHFAMGSSVYYRWNEWGYQETILHLRIGEHPEASVWINHPGEVIQFGYGRPSYWGGCASLPRVHQYRGLALLEFSAAEGQPGFSHAWFPEAEFDESRIEGPLAMARSGAGGVVLQGASGIVPITTGAFANCEIRQNGRQTRWLVRVCETTGLEDMKNRFASLSPEKRENGTIVVSDPEYGEVLFHADGRVEAEGRVIAPDDFTIQGHTNGIVPETM